MAGYRPADWHVLDLDKDPTPGDPHRVRQLARTLHDFADDVADALRLVKGMASENETLERAQALADKALVRGAGGAGGPVLGQVPPLVGRFNVV